MKEVFTGVRCLERNLDDQRVRSVLSESKEGDKDSSSSSYNPAVDQDDIVRTLSIAPWDATRWVLGWLGRQQGKAEWFMNFVNETVVVVSVEGM